MLGFVSAQNGRKQTARSQLNKGIQLEPKAPQAAEAHYILGRYAAEAENFDAAAAHFQRFLQLRPSGAQAEEARKFLADLK
jgi:TolA-binding protein